MEVIVIEKERHKQLLVQLQEVVMRVTRNAISETLSATDSVNDWVDPAEAMRLLNVKKNKLMELRDLKEIIISMHGRKYKYSKRSIHAFLIKGQLYSYREGSTWIAYASELEKFKIS